MSIATNREIQNLDLLSNNSGHSKLVAVKKNKTYMDYNGGVQTYDLQWARTVMSNAPSRHDCSFHHTSRCTVFLPFIFLVITKAQILNQLLNWHSRDIITNRGCHF